jgi:hypothetical protein
VWVIGTATCATYLKCQVYHPALESEWDLQAVPITPRPPPPPPPPLGLSPRFDSFLSRNHCMHAYGVAHNSCSLNPPMFVCFPDVTVLELTGAS